MSHAMRDSIHRQQSQAVSGKAKESEVSPPPSGMLGIKRVIYWRC
jgi:hypothetical protein